MGFVAKLPLGPFIHARTVKNSLKCGINPQRFQNLADINAFKCLPSHNLDERNQNDLRTSKRSEEQLGTFIFNNRLSKIRRLLKISLMEKNVLGFIILPCLNFRA